MRFRKPELIPLLFIVAAEVVLLGLSAWQVQRLEWKTALLAQVEMAQSEPVLTALPQDLTGLTYRNVELPGRFLRDKALNGVGGKQGEKSGFFLLVPFLLPDGRAILVNRGFVPRGAEVKDVPPKAVGVLRPARGKMFFFLPQNQPDKNVWITEDLAAMSAHAGITLLPLIIEATGSHEKGVYPISHNGKIALRNDHLGYAITWFILAAIGIILFMVYHRIPESTP